MTRLLLVALVAVLAAAGGGFVPWGYCAHGTGTAAGAMFEFVVGAGHGTGVVESGVIAAGVV